MIAINDNIVLIPRLHLDVHSPTYTRVIQNGRIADLRTKTSPPSSCLEMAMQDNCKHEHELIQYLIVMDQFALITNPLFMLVYDLRIFTEHSVHVYPAVYR